MAGIKADILLFKKQLGKEDNTTERILDILAQLARFKSHLTLKSTKIGKTVGRLRIQKTKRLPLLH